MVLTPKFWRTYQGTHIRSGNASVQGMKRSERSSSALKNVMFIASRGCGGGDGGDDFGEGGFELGRDRGNSFSGEYDDTGPEVSEPSDPPGSPANFGPCSDPEVVAAEGQSLNGGEDPGTGGATSNDVGKSNHDNPFVDKNEEQLFADVREDDDLFNNKWFCYAWMVVVGRLSHYGCDLFRIESLSTEALDRHIHLLLGQEHCHLSLLQL